MESTSAHQAQRDTRAAYGKACTNCSRAKYKCSYQPLQGSCERCLRLKKDCQSSSAVRKRKSKTDSATKTARLEEKLDRLASLLQSQTEGEPQNPADSASPTFGSIGTSADSTHTSIAGSPSAIADEVSHYEIPDPIAEEQLNTFRQIFLPAFPFIHITPLAKSSELRHQRPFLWLVIMFLSAKSAAQQFTMREKICNVVSQRVVSGEEKSLDILLGIICYLGWYQFSKKDKSTLVMWSQLAIALVFELGIQKIPREEGEVGQFSSRLVGFPPRHQEPQGRSMEERRAVIGVYLVTSMVWTGLRQMEPLRWTPYLDDCVRVLLDAKETDLDILLTTQAKCHVIMDQITRSSVEWAADGDGPKAPAYFIKAMLLQLAEIRRTLPPEIQLNEIAQLYLYSTEMLAREASLKKPKAQEPTANPDLERLAALDSLLTATENWCAIADNRALNTLLGISFSLCAQRSHSMILLFKLSTLSEPGWDIAEVRKRADLLGMLEQQARKVEKVPTLLGLVDAVGSGESSIIFKAPGQIRAIKANFAREMGEVASQTDANLRDNGSTTAAMGDQPIPEDFQMLFEEDPWITDLFASSWDL